MRYGEVLSLIPEVSNDRYVQMMIQAIHLDNVPNRLSAFDIWQEYPPNPIKMSMSQDIERIGCPTSRLLLAYTILRAKYPMSSFEIQLETHTVMWDNLPICTFGIFEESHKRVYHALDLLDGMECAGHYEPRYGDSFLEFSRYRLTTSGKKELPMILSLLEEDVEHLYLKDRYDSVPRYLFRSIIRTRVYEIYERVLRHLPIRHRCIDRRKTFGYDVDFFFYHKL